MYWLYSNIPQFMEHTSESEVGVLLTQPDV